MNEVPAKSTPKKIYVRSSVCRLCGGANESRHMLRVLSKTGLEKNLPSKVHYACGITINDGDFLTKLIYRKCETFIHKVCDFKQQCQNMQTKLELEQYCSVKRCMEFNCRHLVNSLRNVLLAKAEESLQQNNFCSEKHRPRSASLISKSSWKRLTLLQ